jgi:hypothetical protein
VVQQSQRQHDVELPVLLRINVQNVDVMMLDIGETVYILGESESRVVLVAKIERHHPRAASTSGKTKIAVRSPDIG